MSSFVRLGPEDLPRDCEWCEESESGFRGYCCATAVWWDNIMGYSFCDAHKRQIEQNEAAYEAKLRCQPALVRADDLELLRAIRDELAAKVGSAGGQGRYAFFAAETVVRELGYPKDTVGIDAAAWCLMELGLIDLGTRDFLRQCNTRS